MGTDIDLRVEVRREGRWHFSAIPVYDNRCYALFALLADIRQSSFMYRIPAIAGCRGIPEGCRLAEEDPYFDGNDVYSWVSLAELEAVDWTATVVYEDGEVATLFRAVRSFYTETLPALRLLGAPEDVRIVFGFN